MSHKESDKSDSRTPSKKSKLMLESETDAPSVSQDTSETFCASDASPNRSRYGRFHKPKSPGDFLSHDKRISGVMKISPFNQLQYYTYHKEKKKARSSKKNSNQSFDESSDTETPNPEKDNELNKIEEEYLKTWLLGDLVWARIGKHPYWPAMISSDPDKTTKNRHLRKGRLNHLEIHVQFYADNGRRGWITLSNILLFEGRSAFHQLQEKIKKSMKMKEFCKSGLFIKPLLDKWWNSAGIEAEGQMYYTRDERIDYFNRVLSSLKMNKKLLETPKSQKIYKKSTDAVVPEVTKKRKRSEDGVPTGNPSKQPKLESNVEEVRKKEVIKEEIPQPSAPPLRTIADRKKRQATLLELARSCGVIAPNQKRAKESTKEATPEVIKPQKPKVTKTASKDIKSDVKDAKKKIKNKKQGNDFNFYCSKYFTRTKEDYPDLTEKEIYRLLEKRWNDMDESQRSRYKSRLGANQEAVPLDSDDSVSVMSGISENCEQNGETATEPIAAATSKGGVGKRFMSLFSGAKAEKACLICEKPGITVRCRGPCNSYFHLDCIVKRKNNPNYKAEEVEAKKIKVKKGKQEKTFLRNREEPSTSRDNNLSVALQDDSNEVVSPEIVSQSQSSNSSENLDNGEKIQSRKGSKDSDSSEDGEYFCCPECVEGKTRPCFVCNSYTDPKNKSTKMSRCHTSRCGKVYHIDCLKAWPQTTWSAGAGRRAANRTGGEGVMNCPQHCCHTCVSDNPAAAKARYANDKIVRCIRCPTAYHHGNYCIPAGSVIVTQTQIICPLHYQPIKKGISHVNAAWCFICTSGGSLICCDLCPNAFHVDCLNLPPPDGSYICEDCQTGRYPLYGEIVWVKLGSYRWWPAEILYPVQVPENIQNLPHVKGEFAVRFFGSHDYYWVNRGRVFLVNEHDKPTKSSKKSAVDQTYRKAVREALLAHERFKADKALRDAEIRDGMKPPSYIKLKSNKCVGNVKPVEFNLSGVSTCYCKPESTNPCSPDSDCLNRILSMECNPLVCPAGQRCNNQLFEKRVYPALQPFQTETRGWGLKTLDNIKKGDFIIEYVGEMIDEAEYKKRLARLHATNDENYYFLNVDKDRKLDAGPKGNVSRFMNHSCNPNCETQKWTVNQDTRIGLFALTDIAAGTELVFNYNLIQFGDRKLPCMCGASNCSGFIGSKAGKITIEDDKKVKSVKKKLKTPNKVSEEECFICHDIGELILCDNKTCPKAYHLGCLNKARKPLGKGFWVCPWHHCTVCNKGRVRRCSVCVNSYCQEHSDGNIRLHEEEGLLCNEHYKEGVSGGSSITTSSNKPAKVQPAVKEKENINEEISKNSPLVVLENLNLKEDDDINIENSDEIMNKSNIVRFDNVGIENHKMELNFVSPKPVVNGSLGTSDKENITDELRIDATTAIGNIEPKSSGDSNESIINTTGTDITLSEFETSKSSELRDSSISSTEEKNTSSSSTEAKDTSSSSSIELDISDLKFVNGTDSTTENIVKDQNITPELTTDKMDPSKNTEKKMQKAIVDNEPKENPYFVDPAHIMTFLSSDEDITNAHGDGALKSEDVSVKVKESSYEEKCISEASEESESANTVKETGSDVAKEVINDSDSISSLVASNSLNCSANSEKETGSDVAKEVINDSDSISSLVASNSLNYSANSEKETGSDVAKEVINDSDSIISLVASNSLNSSASSESEYLIISASDSLSGGSGAETANSTLNSTVISVDKTVKQSSSSIKEKEGTVTLNNTNGAVDKKKSREPVVALIKMNVNRSERNSLMNESDNPLNTEPLTSSDRADDVISNQNISINR